MNKHIKINYKTAQNMVRSNSIWNTNRNIVHAIKREQKKEKHQFFEFGKVSKAELSLELAKYNFSFPKELIHIWLEFGGGELWETENILYPLFSNDDLIETVESHNKYAIENGFDNNYFIFATDTLNYTAFEKKTHEVKVFTYNDNKWNIQESYNNIIDWFSYLLWTQYNVLVLTKE